MLQVNEAPLIDGKGNSLLSTTQARENAIKIDNVAKKAWRKLVNSGREQKHTSQIPS